MFPYTVLAGGAGAVLVAVCVVVITCVDVAVLENVIRICLTGRCHLRGDLL